MKNIKEILLRKAVKAGQFTGLIKSKVMKRLGRDLIKTILPKEIEIKVGNNSRMVINPKEAYYLLGYEEHEPLVSSIIIKSLREGDVFIDIGAYIGYYSLLAREVVGVSGKVIAFEPHPENYKKLVRNIHLNAYTNIVPENIAISDKRERLKLFLGINPSTHSIIERSPNNVSSDEFFEVEAISLDEYLDGRNIVPNVIKMDVEGAELKILSGMKKTIRSYHPTMIIEVHPLHLGKKGVKILLETLKDHGYRLFKVQEEGLSEGSVNDLYEFCEKTHFNKYGTEINPFILACVRKLYEKE